MIQLCRSRVPDATDEEIAWAVEMTIPRIRTMRNLTNPTGMLITQVPKCFEGESFRLYRESAVQRREAEHSEHERRRRDAEAVLADPDSSEDDRTWARTVLEST